MILPAEDSLHLEFWGLLRGCRNARAPKEAKAAAAPAAAASATPAAPAPPVTVAVWRLLLFCGFLVAVWR